MDNNACSINQDFWGWLFQIDNIAIVILMLACAAFMYSIKTLYGRLIDLQKEHDKQMSLLNDKHREDQKEAWDTVNNLNKSLERVKYVIAAVTGKTPEQY